MVNDRKAIAKPEKQPWTKGSAAMFIFGLLAAAGMVSVFVDLSINHH